MRTRDTLALNLAPFFLRIALASFFVWTGASKIFHDNNYTGQAAATLANMGVIDGDNPDRPRPDVEPEPSTAPALDDESGDRVPPSEPQPTAEASPLGAQFILVQDEGVAADAPQWVAADFTEPVVASRVHTVTLMLKRAADQDRWPAFASADRTLTMTAWVICVAEFVGGILIFAGFFTRLASLGLLVVSVGSLVFTVVIPSMGVEGAFLGFLPDHQLANPTAWVDAWSPAMIRLFAAATAASLFFSGAGKLSLDALLFPSGSDGGSDASSGGDDDD